MKISGFSMAKNADKLYYPIREVVLSALPLVDEFVVAVGDCDPDDRTRSLLESIRSEKLSIVDTVWDLEKYPKGMENAHQTDIAKSHCSGDWLLYLQADEVIHEDDFEMIRNACEKYLNDSRVEGFLFRYHHFWGDYDHCHFAHSWYKREIRIIRNNPDIHSWESAQSFRRIPDFDGIHYRQQEGTFKLRVIEINARIFHYGWVRPPELMQKKTKALDTIHKGAGRVAEMEVARYYDFDYGPLGRIPEYAGTHPGVMKEWIRRFHWREALSYDRKYRHDRRPHRHERLKYRLLSWLENTIFGGRTLGGFRNYHYAGKFRP
jgi:hypothetical protein